MLRRITLVMLVAAVALFLGAEVKARKVVCLIIMEESGSAEANSLFQRFMGVQPEALRWYAPTQFELTSKGFSASVEGEFGYSAGSFSPLERYGKAVLGKIEVELRALKPPKAVKTVTVELNVDELAASGVQPAALAIETGARRLGWQKGRAWIEQIELASPGHIRAKVGFAR